MGNAKQINNSTLNKYCSSYTGSFRSGALGTTTLRCTMNKVGKLPLRSDRMPHSKCQNGNKSLYTIPYCSITKQVLN